MRQGPLNMPYEVWCNNIAPKLKNIENTLRKQGFFDFFFNFNNFLKFVPLVGNLSAKLNSLLIPCDPWEPVHIYLNKNSVQTGSLKDQVLAALPSGVAL